MPKLGVFPLGVNAIHSYDYRGSLRLFSFNNPVVFPLDLSFMKSLALTSGPLGVLYSPPVLK